MVVKSEIKLIRSLQQKKYRTLHGLFVAEGVKSVLELMQSHLKAHKIYSTDPSLLQGLSVEKSLVTPVELKKMSSLQTPNKLLGVFHIPATEPIDEEGWILALDAVQDPGNLGTIIRLCDWFGLRDLVCSSDTVDCYNAKVLQATMGSIARVNIIYTRLDQFLDETSLPKFAAVIDGTPVYDTEWPASGILLMGNEAHGIADAVLRKCPNKITIPQYGSESTESLNVGTATAILLNELRRPTQK